jgi:hypothetical protein
MSDYNASVWGCLGEPSIESFKVLAAQPDRMDLSSIGTLVTSLVAAAFWKHATSLVDWMSTYSYFLLERGVPNIDVTKGWLWHLPIHYYKFAVARPKHEELDTQIVGGDEEKNQNSTQQEGAAEQETAQEPPCKRRRSEEVAVAAAGLQAPADAPAAEPLVLIPATRTKQVAAWTLQRRVSRRQLRQRLQSPLWTMKIMMAATRTKKVAAWTLQRRASRRQLRQRLQSTLWTMKIMMAATRTKQVAAWTLQRRVSRHQLRQRLQNPLWRITILTAATRTKQVAMTRRGVQLLLQPIYRQLSPRCGKCTHQKVNVCSKTIWWGQRCARTN